MAITNDLRDIGESCEYPAPGIYNALDLIAHAWEALIRGPITRLDMTVKTLRKERIAPESLRGRLGPYRSIEGDSQIVNNTNPQTYEKEGLIRDPDGISTIWAAKFLPSENHYIYNIGRKSLCIEATDSPSCRLTFVKPKFKIFLLLRTISLPHPFIITAYMPAPRHS